MNSKSASPFFSVIMANYNNERFIKQAVESVLAQTHADFELLFIDDCSRDNSLEVVKEFAHDARLKVIARPVNEGYVAALKHGIAIGSGEVIAVVDPDDAITPDTLRLVHEAYLSEQELSVVLTNLMVCDAGLRPLWETTMDERSAQDPLLWMKGMTSMRTFKKSAYERTAGLDASIVSAEDCDLLFKLEEVGKAHRVRAPLYYYRQLDDSQSNEPRKKLISWQSLAIAIARAQLRRRHRSACGHQLPTIVLQAWINTGLRSALELRSLRRVGTLCILLMRIAPLSAASWRILHRFARSLGQWFGDARKDPSRWSLYLAARTFQGGFQSRTGNVEPDRISCVPLVHEEGHAMYGGDGFIRTTGLYRAVFDVKIGRRLSDRSKAFTIDIYENFKRNTVLAKRTIRFQGKPASHAASLEFHADAGERVEFRLYWYGGCELEIHGVRLSFLEPPPG